MPYGDEKHRQVLEALTGALGEDYVEDDPAVMEAFAREAQTPLGMSRARLEFVVLPGTTAEVQAVVRLANELRFPFSVTTTGLLLITFGPIKGHDHWCLIDMKRFNHFTVDAQNKYAVLEPYVSVAQVQAETMRHGLFTGVTGAGAQASALVTQMATGTHWTGWRSSKGRNLLGLEMVLPDGEIMRSGTLTTATGDYAWGEGPGLEAAGLLRGAMGAMGTLGIVTRAGVKLHSWPGPKIWPCEGVQPEKSTRLPEDIFRTFIFSYGTLEACIEGVRELGEAEIAGVVLQPNPFDLVMLAARNREDFWARWQSDFWQRQIHQRHLVLVNLWGYAGAAQVDYETTVLKEIVTETGGEFFPEDVLAWLAPEVEGAMVRDSHRGRYMRLAVPGTDVYNSAESLEDALRAIRIGNEIKAKYTPPLGDKGKFDMGAAQHKFWPADFGRVASVGIMGFGEKSDACEEVTGPLRGDAVEYNLAHQAFDIGTSYEASRYGAAFGNVHFLLDNIKRRLDPFEVANPGRLINRRRMDRMLGESEDAAAMASKYRPTPQA